MRTRSSAHRPSRRGTTQHPTRHDSFDPQRTPTGGRHESGQNFLVDARVASDIADAVASWPTPRTLVELGPGDGAITRPLVALGIPLTVVEIDPRYVRRLRERYADVVDVVHGDMMRFPFPDGCGIVSNVPYHLTTPLLKKLLASTSWSHAMLVLQWEVARKRAAVGGTTLLTVRWWPWYDFSLLRRVSARSFRPVPSVDSGILQIARRTTPLVRWADRREYQRLVERVFAARGNGVRAMASRVVGGRVASRWVKQHRIAPSALPKHVDASGWAALYRLAVDD